jgi:hypothetical protein
MNKIRMDQKISEKSGVVVSSAYLRAAFSLGLTNSQP